MNRWQKLPSLRLVGFFCRPSLLYQHWNLSSSDICHNSNIFIMSSSSKSKKVPFSVILKKIISDALSHSCFLPQKPHEIILDRNLHFGETWNPYRILGLLIDTKFLHVNIRIGEVGSLKSLYSSHWKSSWGWSSWLRQL